MTRETRVAMLIGLLFIVMFGLVLAELTGQDSAPSPIKAGEKLTARPYAPILERASIEDNPYVTQHEQRLEAATRLAAADENSVVEVVPLAPGERSIPMLNEQLIVAIADEPAPAPQASRPSVPAVVHTVTTGDTLIKIARLHYGSGNEMEYKRILDANRNVIRDEKSLRVGQELVIPPAPAAAVAAGSAPEARNVAVLDMEALRQRFSSGPAAASDALRQHKTHVVRRGDNLAKIAREFYRSNSHANIMKIYNANRSKLSSPDRLTVGMELEIPS
ncbi:MAG: LysM peptidoglycan-binding domain-containing protein [Planctomycetes bacterium]|jgi:nucleoid-associated protein YgaU|nr:LysM peptidoglycan-binding domain-containing protein [Planctomycetota bacterium]